VLLELLCQTTSLLSTPLNVANNGSKQTIGHTLLIICTSHQVLVQVTQLSEIKVTDLH